MNDISIVIPFYNDSKSCIRLVNSYIASLTHLKLKFEFIITDDCSTVEESNAIKEAFESKSTVQIFRFNKNIGQYGSLAFGISKAKGKLLLITDQDILDLPTEDLAVLIKNGVDFDLQYIYQENNQRGITRKVFSSLWHLFIVLNIRRKASLENPLPFRLISNQLREKILANNYTVTTLDIALLKYSKKYFFYKIDNDKPLVIKTKSEYSISMLIKVGIYSIIFLITDLKAIYCIFTLLLAICLGFYAHSLTLPLITLSIAIIIFGMAWVVSKEQSYKEQIKQIAKCVEK